MRVDMGMNYTFTNALVPTANGQLIGKGKGEVNETGITTKGDLYVQLMYTSDNGISAGMTAGTQSTNCTISAPQGACLIRMTKHNFMSRHIYNDREILVNNPYKATDIDFYMLAVRQTDSIKIEKRSEIQWRSSINWRSNASDAPVNQTSINITVPVNMNTAGAMFLATALSNMDSWIIAKNNQYKQKVATWSFMEDAKLIDIQQQLADLSLDDRSLAGTIRLYYLGISSYYGTKDGTEQDWDIIQTSAESQYPIFHYDQIQDIVDYFRNGGGKPENEDYRELKDVDLSTNWKVYIDGNYPNITITGESPDLDSWLESAGNTEALSKKDFSINSYWRQIQQMTELKVLYGIRHELDKTNYGGSMNSLYNTILNKESVAMPTNGKIALTLQMGYGLYKSAPVDIYVHYIGNPNDPNFDEKRFTWNFSTKGKIAGENYFFEIVRPFFTDNSTVEFLFKPYEGNDDPPDPTPPDDDIVIDKPSDITDQSTLLTHYILSTSQLKQLGNFLWGETFSLKDLFNINSSPIQNITSVKHCPIKNCFSTESSNLMIGNVDTGINALKINTTSTIKVGQIHIQPLYHSFLDFAPYTTVTLFLPFYGFLDLDATLFGGVESNRLLEVYLVPDITTGTFEYMIYRGGVFIKKVTTSGMVEMSITANDSAIVNSRAAVGLVSDLIPSVPGGMFSNSPTQVQLTSQAWGVNYGIKAAKTFLEYAQPFYTSETKGTNAPNCAWSETRQLYVIVTRPYANTYPTTYGHTVGFPLKASRQLSSLTGYTQCNADIDLSGISALDEEKNELRALLANGVFL